MLLVRKLERKVRSCCITAHSLAMFLPQIGDSVQQVQLAGAAARRLDLDEAAHCDSQQTHGRPPIATYTAYY